MGPWLSLLEAFRSALGVRIFGWVVGYAVIEQQIIWVIKVIVAFDYLRDFPSFFGQEAAIIGDLRVRVIPFFVP